MASDPAGPAAVEEENVNGGEEEEVDPKSMAVLAGPREDGRSYVLDGGDGKPVFVQYEAVEDGGVGHEKEVLPAEAAVTEEVLPVEAENGTVENGIENMEEEDTLLDPDYVDFKNHLKVENGWMVLEWEGFDPLVYERPDVPEIESGGDDDDHDVDDGEEFDFEKELKAELERPYDEDEYEEKMRAANCALPQEKLRHLRSGSRSYPTESRGYSLLHHYKDLEAQIQSADCHTGLVLLRGFFFWLTLTPHLPRAAVMSAVLNRLNPKPSTATVEPELLAKTVEIVSRIYLWLILANQSLGYDPSVREEGGPLRPPTRFLASAESSEAVLRFDFGADSS
ncbi:hypothetical protein QJS10_CPB15g01691 [Acorus calamus]|uniref:Uncharacterized protein n=1 Tax=Acorus calamus TaxID=4465 RepID=A0AAV9D570_ACOCL|nr:hypothetical protein QJS10_CPB15g01691 [Acorus calamus]